MKQTSVMEKDNMEQEDLVHYEGKSTESVEENSSSEDSKKEPEDIMVLKTRRLPSNRTCNKQLFMQNICALDNKIPKYIISLDEQYLLRCLEWMHVSAFGATSGKISTKMGILPNSLSSGGLSYKSTLDTSRFIMECPLAAVTNGVAITDSVSVYPAGDSILGAISSSKSMINILRSPLLHQIGALDSNTHFGRRSLLDNKVATGSELISSPSKVITSSPKKLKEMVLGDQGYESESGHRRIASFSSTNSTCSDQSSSSPCGAVSQGMLKCSWKDGFPNYIFSVDDQGEIYLANLIKSQSPDDKSLDYIYMFHLKSGGKRETEIPDVELKIVGKMKVSTSVTLCPKNSAITQTQFVLYGSSDYSTGEMQTSAHAFRKNKGLTKKVADVFRTSQSRKSRTYSSFWGTSTIFENASLEPSEDVQNNPDQGRATDVENSAPPNLELAAIIVKNHIYENPKKPQIGGWGLNFLKKSGTKQASALIETSISSECSQRGTGECSTSMDILVPAGFHGGPRTRAGGPSSLVERWSSGGHCDCGGWDAGCPLTILNPAPNRMRSPSQPHIAEDCKSVDLFVKVRKILLCLFGLHLEN